MFDLCVSDVDQITASGNGLIPDPHIGDVRICRIAIQSRLYVPFQIDTAGIRINGVVPAVHGFAVQRKTDTLGIALSKTYPVADVKCRLCGFLLGWLCGLCLICRFWFFRCRRCRLFFSGSLGCGSTAVLWSARSGTSVVWGSLSDTLAGNSAARLSVCDSVLWGRSTSVFFSA